MRLLSAANYVEEIGDQEYRSSPLTKAMAVDSVAAMSKLQ